jgi:hypothetical protein
MSSMMNSNELTTMYTDVDIDRLSFTELKEGKNSKGQKTAYPVYNHPSAGEGSPLCIQFPWISMSTYGIPKIGEYVKSDSDRLYIKCPLDLSCPEIDELYNSLIIKLDNYLSSDSVKNIFFLKKASKYEYNSIFKTPKLNDDDDDDAKLKKSTTPKPPFLKLKFDVTYPENDMKTKVFKTVEGNSKREKLNDIITISDMEKIICWKCRFRPIVRLSKVWAQTVGTGKYGPGYGATLTIIKIEVEPPANTGLGLKYKQYQEEDTFLDDNKTSNKTVEKPQVELKKQAQIIDSDGSDEEKPSLQKSKPVIVSDDDSEEEIKPAKSKKHLQKAKPVIESDVESDEEIKPVKSAKGKAVAKKK